MGNRASWEDAVWRMAHESRGAPRDPERIGLLRHANNLGSSRSPSLVGNTHELELPGT